MTAWLTRWIAALRIARRDALRNKRRSILVVLLMMLPVAAGVFAIGVYRMSTATPHTQVKWAMGSSAQARVINACGSDRAPTQQYADGISGSVCGSSEESKSLNPPTQEEWSSVLPKGTEVVEAVSFRGAFRTADVLVEPDEVVQVDTAQVPGLLDAVAGAADPSTGEVVLERSVAKRLGAALGDDVEIDVDGTASEVTVVGIGDGSRRTGAILGPDSLPADTGNAIWFLSGQTPIAWSDVMAINTIGLTVQSRAVILDPPPPDQVYGGQYHPPVDLNAILGYSLGVGGLILLELILLVGPAFAVGAKRSTRSLALVAAAGGEPRDLRRIVLANGVVAGIGAGAIGVLIGAGASMIVYAVQYARDEPMANLRFPLWEWAGIAAIALILGVAAAWFPARAAGRTDTIAVLAGREGDPPRRRAVPWVGAGLAGVGLVVGILAATLDQPVMLAAGGIAVELGIVMSVGAIVALFARLAPGLGVAGRFALRDAVRHRGRTTPAVAAVLATVAAMTVALSMVVSNGQAQLNMWRPVAAEGTGLLVGTRGWDRTVTEVNEQYEQVKSAIAKHLPGSTIAPVRALMIVDQKGRPDETGEFATPFAMTDPVKACPDPQTLASDAEDPRCRTEGGPSTTPWGWNLVDDGTFVRTLGLEEASDAAAALAGGYALTNVPNAIWPDGKVHVALGSTDEKTNEVFALPAHLVPWSSDTYRLVLPPEAADRFPVVSVDGDSTNPDGYEMEARIVGATVTGTDITQAQLDGIARGLEDVAPEVTFQIEEPSNKGSGAIVAILSGVAVFVALAATGLSVGLAFADSRADLATLAAVGASPRFRRKLTAAQAGVIATVGAVLGIATGLGLSLILGRWNAHNLGYGDAWTTIFPWLNLLIALVAIPALAMAGGWVFTRSRLPISRRIQ